MSYKSGKDVVFQSSNNQNVTLQNTNNFQKTKPAYGLCPKKNYIIPPTKEEEDYIFLSGTVRPPFKRQFNLDAVT